MTVQSGYALMLPATSTLHKNTSAADTHGSRIEDACWQASIAAFTFIIVSVRDRLISLRSMLHSRSPSCVPGIRVVILAYFSQGLTLLCQLCLLVHVHVLWIICTLYITAEVKQQTIAATQQLSLHSFQFLSQLHQELQLHTGGKAMI